MKQSKSWAIYAFLVFLMVLVGCASEAKTLKLNPSKLDFGEVNIGDTGDIIVTLTNKYSDTITINSFQINDSSDFSVTAGNTSTVELEKGAEHEITITFEPATSGLIEGTLVISHTGADEPKETTLKGIGVPVARIDLSDTTFTFAKTLLTKSRTHDVTVKNTGTAILTVSTLTFTGTDSAYFTISAGDAPFDITPGLTHDFTITYTPTVLGNHTADLNIDHNAVGADDPLLYPVLGEGIDVDPQITLSESSPWDFGSIATTMPTRLYLEMSNTGTDPLLITDAVLQTNTEFKIVDVKDESYNTITFPQTVLVGKKIYVWITFTPTAKTTYTDILKIDHDGTNENSPWNFEIKGEGRDVMTKKYSYTGAAEQFQVPANISMVKVELYGAAGGNGYPYSSGNYDGGKGGLVEATFNVTPGITMNVYVGGKGTDGTSTSDSPGGWNGGGKSHLLSTSHCGGGGGGASDIRVGGTALTDRIVVAGGGGGSGHTGNPPENGGKGGGETGENGYIIGQFLDAYCGKGGTQTAGGAAATNGGQAGSIGQGGDGDSAYSGGGGGGGYYGGGGGHYGGAGGGSSYPQTGVNNAVHTQGVHTGDGEIIITY